MSLLKSFRNLSFRTRLGVGVGLLAWGVIGLQLSDRAETRFGFEPTDEEREALNRALPRITTIDRSTDSGNRKEGGSGGVGN